MPFVLPSYTPPDFSSPALRNAPLAEFRPVEIPGVAPQTFHATSVYPEYFQVAPRRWILLRESRMDCVVVREGEDALSVKEFRRLEPGDRVACGRGERGEEGIYVHETGFEIPRQSGESFAFRTGFSRETPFSVDYDQLYDLLRYERDKGFVLWVLGPAVAFDRDARTAFSALVDAGYVHGLLAGNALATHDVEASLFGTALGMEIYGKRRVPLGHYHHLDTLNRIRGAGGLAAAIAAGLVTDGIMRAVIGKGVPYVLAGSIRDDGPLPEVVSDAYEAQDRMRALARRATTVIALATQLHTIATGNMVSSYAVGEDGQVRPVYFYTVDISEFAVGKLANRGSLTARPILTNVQDFIVTLQRGLLPITD